MAVRDRNLFAWQAYVMTATIVSVLVLGGMFFLWRNYSDLSKRFEEQKGSLANASQEFSTSEKRVDRLLSMMGYGEYTEADLQSMAQQFATDERLADVEKDFAEQMKLFPESQPANEKNLMKLPRELTDTIRIRNQQLAAAQARANGLNDELAATVDRETQKTQDAVNKQKAAEADLAKAREDHAAGIARLNAEKEDALKQFGDYRAQSEKAVASLRNENTRLTAVNTRQAETIEAQKSELLQYKDPDFAAPQGEIVRVADGGNVVWINLGSEDGLRKGVTFSVLDESEIKISDATPKAKLVVTRIVADHLCVAELIGNTDYRNPAIAGDKVYSPLWRPGRKVGIALVGLMDINDDRKDDIDQILQLVNLAGGVIDERMDTNGVRSGAGMTPNTEFLVLGTDLTIPENATPELRAQQQARLSTYAQFIDEAKQNGSMTVSLEKLMGFLKIEGADRTIPLGNRTRAEDFAITEQNNPPASRGKVSEIFEPRKP